MSKKIVVKEKNVSLVKIIRSVKEVISFWLIAVSGLVSGLVLFAADFDVLARDVNFFVVFYLVLGLVLFLINVFKKKEIDEVQK